MIRRVIWLFAVFLAVGSLTWAPISYAVGLGDLDLKSALNQKFYAEVELTNVQGFEPEEVLPNLASSEAFARVGVERNDVLLDLRFKIVRRGDGELVIAITSTKPIIEPFLNFIVEILWPSGRILREYTVLLDPPVFGEQGISPIQATESPLSSRQNEASRQDKTPARTENVVSRTERDPFIAEEVTAEEVTAKKDAVEKPANEIVQKTVSGSFAETGITAAGDTLWKIALDVRPDSSVSVQQTMLALQRANPDAFINNNINLLKAGHVLRIPNAREMRAGNIDRAVDEVREQNSDFARYKRGETGSARQLDASRRQSTTGRDTPAVEQGELKLLASSETRGRRAGDGGNGESSNEALQNDLSVAAEDLDRARLENSELSSRLADIEAQSRTLDELIALKDEELAQLKEMLRQQMEAAAQPGSPQSAAVSNTDNATNLLTNPLVLAGLALLLIGSVAGGLLYTRKKRQAIADEDVGLDGEHEFAATSPVGVAPVTSEQDWQESETLVEVEPELEEEVAPETNDVLGEVEIYIAYGRFPQAITFLQNAIDAEPQRADIQLKLLEVYTQTEDATGFNLQFEQLRLLGDEAANQEASALQQKIPGAAEVSAAAMDATVISTNPIEAIGEPEDDDEFSFDLDDLDAENDDDEFSLDLDDELLLADSDDDLALDVDDSSQDSLSQDSLSQDNDVTLLLEEADELLSLDSEDDDDDDDLLLALDDDDLELDDDEFELSLDDDDELSLDLDNDNSGDTDIALDEDDLGLSLDDDALDLDGADSDDSDLKLDEDDLGLSLDDDELDLDDTDSDDTDLKLDEDDLELSLDDDDDDEIRLDLDETDSDDDELSLSLDDDDELSLDLDDAELDEDELNLELDDGDLNDSDDSDIKLDKDDLDLSLDDDDEFKLDLDDDDDFSLDDDALDLSEDDSEETSLVDLGDDKDAISADISNDQTVNLAADELNLLDDDDLDLTDDDLDDEFSLDFDDDDDLDLDDDEFSLDFDDEDDDDNNKLDLARAYIDMGDSDGAKSILDKVIADGSDSEVQEANQLLARIT